MGSELCIRDRPGMTAFDSKADGPWEWFWDNGQLWVRENYIDGKQDDLYESFHENGQLEIRGNYIDGKSCRVSPWPGHK